MSRFIDRLRRITRDHRWIAEIDGLRFVAIVSVVLFHLSEELQRRAGRIIPIEHRYSNLFRFVEHGDRGVPLFFIISGFVLAIPFARHFLDGAGSVSLRKFYLRRLTRLEPPYLASVCIFLALVYVHQHYLSAEYLRHAIASATYLHGLIYAEMTPVNPVSWSLEVEIQFYVLAPLLTQLYRVSSPWMRRCLLCGIVMAVSFAQLGIHSPERASWTVLFYLQFFIMGLLLADLYITDSERIPFSFAWDAWGIAALILSFSLPRSVKLDHLLLPWMMAGIFAAALRGRLLQPLFANRFVAVIGGMCYSIYLLHFQLIAVFFKMNRRLILAHADFLTNYAIQLIFTGIPVVAVCVLFYSTVERPCMDPSWPSKVWSFLKGRNRSLSLTSEGLE